MSIQKILFEGFRWTSISSLLNFGLGLLQVVLLVHYLEKSDFAWVAIAGVFVNIGIQLQQAGINTAIVQHSTLTQIQLSTAYWLNACIGVILYIIAIILAFLLSSIYENPILLPIFMLYSLIFFIQGFTVQYKALLQKKFYFQTLSIGESIGGIGGFMFAIISVMKGLGAYALVGSYVIRYLVEAIWVVSIGIKLFRPAIEWNWRSVQSLLDFGGWHIGERLVTHFSSQIDILLIGKLLGSEALGTYDIFKRVLVRPLNLLNEIFEKVIFPVLSSLKGEFVLQKQLYLNLLAHLGAINFPALFFLVIAAEPIVQLIFGVHWVENVAIFRSLCLFCLFHFLLNPVDSLLLAVGKIRLWLLANLIFLPFQILFLAIGSQFSLITTTLANVIAYSIFMIATYYLIVLPQIRGNPTELIQSIFRPFLITFITTLFLIPFLYFSFPPIMLIPVGIMFTAIYLLLTYYYNHKFILMIQQFLKIKT
ncbi:MAG: MOP flippase family protein [Saprospiraceae bacterium]|nr:MOP flippase family protein [Saprospiraceae bacterium]